ncbi:MAG: MarR family transcriptional regulator [Phototrophicaceae bacterium]
MTVTHREAQEIRMLAVLMLKIPRQLLEQRFAEENIDLTMLQHHIMTMAQRHQPTIAELSRTFGLDPSTLVSTVDTLVKKGYLRRERDPNDRRRYPLHLTESGTDLHHHICNNLGDDPLHLALQTLDASDVTALNQILRRIVTTLPDGEAALNELDANIEAYDATKDPKS